MAPSTLNRPATAPYSQQPSQATLPNTHPTLEEELNLPMDTEDKEEEEIALAHPSSYKDEVTKLKRKIQELKKQHDELLNAARYNSKVAKTKIEDLEGRVTNIAGIAENLGKEAEKSQRLYKEYIEHTAALALTGKDPGEIL
ncbi:hypothetical protein FIE12Z_11940 [Fusarium flagelliforme]|uniref:Uncharacterized protein n=1 Tax=Fusarium flagelliforme TaxID=2675880 RepID=A0A395M7I7_9HYPO|nr:hypothetical protein FIE12Z_11940 [Fusarium flagelliforme]